MVADARWTLLIQGTKTVPKFNAQFNPYSLRGGTDGWLFLGTFGLWMALLIARVAEQFEEITTWPNYYVVSG